jgi:hypothetical protein
MQMQMQMHVELRCRGLNVVQGFDTMQLDAVVTQVGRILDVNLPLQSDALSGLPPSAFRLQILQMQ